MAVAGSSGVPTTSGPANCIAPAPVRRTCRLPNGNVETGTMIRLRRLSRPVAAVAELVDQGWLVGGPAELCTSLVRDDALIEQQDVREIVAQARPGLVVGTGDSPRCADRDGGCLGQFRNGRALCVGDDVGAAGRARFQRPAEDVSQV